MAQFELVMLATNFEVHRTYEAATTSPRNHFLSLSFPDLEIVIDERPWVDRHGFPPFTNILDREIWEFDFLTTHVLYARPVRSLLLRCCVSGDATGENQHPAEEEDESRIILHSLKIRHSVFVLKVRSTSQVYWENISWECFHVSLIFVKMHGVACKYLSQPFVDVTVGQLLFSLELTEVGQ